MVDHRLLIDSTSFPIAATNWAEGKGLLDESGNVLGVFPVVLGVPAQSPDLGAFSVGIIPTNSTIKQALQALETNVSTKTDNTNNLSDLSNIPTARNNLGLGTAALVNTGTSGTSIPLLSGTNEWSLIQTFSGGSINLKTTASVAAIVSFSSNALKRWTVGKGNSAETGSNAGSNFKIDRYDDTGTLIDTPVSINRSTAQVTLSQPLPVTSGGLGVTTLSAFKASLNLDQVDNTSDVNKPASAAMLAAVATATDQANAAIAATGATGAPYPNSAATYLPQGVAAWSLTSGGTGGTNATNSLATYTGGTLTYNPTIRFDIVGGIVVNVRLISPGLYIGTGTPTMPTVTFPGGAGSPAITLTAGVIVPSGATYWVLSSDGSQILQYGNNAGTIATAPFGGTQNVMYTKTGVDAVVPPYTSYRLATLETVLGLQHGPVNGPKADGFDGPTGSITGRSLSGGGIWENAFYTGSNAAPLSILVAGKLSGTQGTTPNGAFDYVQGTTSGKWWSNSVADFAAVTDGTSSGFKVVGHLTVGSGNFSGYCISTGASGVPAGLFFNNITASVVGTRSTLKLNVTTVNGDRIQVRETISGAGQFYLNGRILGNSFDISTTTVPMTYKYGFRGSLQNTGPIDAFELGDPTTTAMVSSNDPARVVQMESDGSVIRKLRGEFSLYPAPYLSYRVTDASGAELVSYTVMPSYVTSSLTYTGKTVAITSPPSTGFRIEIQRPDILVTVPPTHGPIQKAGHVIFGTGQSLIYNPWYATTGGSDAAPADAWLIDGNVGSNPSTITRANPSDRLQAPVAANSPLAKYVTTLRSLLGSSVPLSFVAGCIGGTLTSARAPGTANYTAALDGVDFGGGDIGYTSTNLGQFEATTTPSEITTCIGVNNTILDGVVAKTGREVKGLMIPLTSCWAASDANAEQMRYLQWMAVQSYPTRYALGPYIYDLQHAAGDGYHHNAAAYIEQARREATEMARLISGGSVASGLGPSLNSALRTSGTQITVLYILNGATGLEITNTGYASDFRGGVRFYTDNTFTTEILPTTATINAVVGSLQSITYTFTSVPVGAVVRGPYGAEPFNPTHDTTIQADYANKASILRGINASGNVPVQPFYQVSGVNYIVAV